MLFHSLDFLLFFPAVAAVYFLLPGRVRYLWLLVASYYFYMGWNPQYALLIAFSTAVTYGSGLALERAGSVRQKKSVVFVSFFLNLGLLVCFKYFDFLLANVNRVGLLLHVPPIQKPFDVLLPVGISFYTFQALGYTMDVYRGEIRAEKNPLRYALFVSFFPQLVAGPIERSGNLLVQLRNVPQTVKFDYERVTGGLTLMLWGYFQKLVIADRLAIMVDRVFADYYLYQSTPLLAGAVGFSLQIYCDFASYSLIAIGAAKVFGFSLMENFNTPYFAVNIQDFWRRWHVSLSTWFRDYLYIPLGGSRCPKLRRYGNLLITFLISGLWHGASWSYVAWGGIHALYQILEKELSPAVERFNMAFHVKINSFSYRFGQSLLTFFLTVCAWVFFRAESIRTALAYLWRILTRVDWWSWFDGSWYIWAMARQASQGLLFGVIVSVLENLVRYKRGQQFAAFLKSQSP